MNVNTEHRNGDGKRGGDNIKLILVYKRKNGSIVFVLQRLFLMFASFIVVSIFFGLVVNFISSH